MTIYKMDFIIKDAGNLTCVNKNYQLGGLGNYFLPDKKRCRVQGARYKEKHKTLFGFCLTLPVDRYIKGPSINNFLKKLLDLLMPGHFEEKLCLYKPDNSAMF